MIKKFHVESALEPVLLLKKHFPLPEKKIDLIFENFAKFCTKAIFFIVNNFLSIKNEEPTQKVAEAEALSELAL